MRGAKTPYKLLCKNLLGPYDIIWEYNNMGTTKVIWTEKKM